MQRAPQGAAGTGVLVPCGYFPGLQREAVSAPVQHQVGAWRARCSGLQYS
ncbi:hypothetical protein IMCC9480_939 [Oxalobacteraceae bacterium IMCC9480]|nr:hypothetical protein IMCC9480_939 [Oxalobacteraceae bacterium IMCC9480]